MTSSALSTSSPTSTQTTAQSSSTSKLSSGVIAGIVVSAVVACTGVCGSIYWGLRRRRYKQASLDWKAREPSELPDNQKTRAVIRPPGQTSSADRTVAASSLGQTYAQPLSTYLREPSSTSAADSLVNPTDADTAISSERSHSDNVKGSKGKGRLLEYSATPLSMVDTMVGSAPPDAKKQLEYKS